MVWVRSDKDSSKVGSPLGLPIQMDIVSDKGISDKYLKGLQYYQNTFTYLFAIIKENQNMAICIAYLE